MNIEEAVRALLLATGDDDLDRDGLLDDTPRRVAKAWGEWFRGYKMCPEEILSKTFNKDTYDEIVVLRGIPFHSHCEHHLAPISGTVDVAYLPGPKVVGLSKLSRLVECFSRRLQMQERMTQQIAEALMQHLDALGAAVVVRGTHGCMTTRGVNIHGAEMITSAMLGRFRENAEARAEVLALLR